MWFLSNHSKPLGNSRNSKIYHLLILVDWFWLVILCKSYSQFLSYLLKPNTSHWKEAPVNWCVPELYPACTQHDTEASNCDFGYPEQSNLNALRASGDLHEPRVRKDRIFDQHRQHSVVDAIPLWRLTFCRGVLIFWETCLKLKQQNSYFS